MRKIFLMSIVVLSVLVGTVAGMIIITPTTRTFDAMSAGSLRITGDLDVTDEGLFTILGSFTAAGTLASPVLFPDTATGVNTARTNIADSDFHLDFQVFTKSAGVGTPATPANQEYAVHLRLSTEFGTGSTDATIYIATGATVAPGSSIVCEFDLGSSLHPDFQYILTVSRV